MLQTLLLLISLLASSAFAGQLVRDVTLQDGMLNFSIWNPFVEERLESDKLHAHGGKLVHVIAVSQDRASFLHVHPVQVENFFTAPFNVKKEQTWTITIDTAIQSESYQLELLGVDNQPQTFIPVTGTVFVQSNQQKDVLLPEPSLSTSVSPMIFRRGVDDFAQPVNLAAQAPSSIQYHVDAEVLSRKTSDAVFMTNNQTLPTILGKHCNVFGFRVSRTVTDRFAGISPNTQAVRDIKPWLDSWMHVVAIHQDGWTLHTHAVPVPHGAANVPDLCSQTDTKGWLDQEVQGLVGPDLVAPLSLTLDGHYDIFVQFTADRQPSSLDLDMVVARFTIYKGMRRAAAISSTNPANYLVILLPILALFVLICIVILVMWYKSALCFKPRGEALPSQAPTQKQDDSAALLEKDFEEDVFIV